MKLIKYTSATLCVICLSGCGSLSTLRWNSDAGPQTALDVFEPAQHRLIADNLLSVISQFDELPPWSTTVQMSHTNTPFGLAVQKSIMDAGYGTQDVEGDLGVNLIRYLAENAETEQGFRTRYRVEIGELYAERDFHIIGNSLVPTSEMRVSNNTDTLLSLDDSVFDNSLFDDELSYVSAVNIGEPEIRVIEFNRGAFKLDKSKTDSSTGIFAKLGNSSNNDTSEILPVTGKTNMYESVDSNFSSLFKDYEDTLSGIIVFPDDSLALGESNKSYLRNLVKTFDPETEIFSVIGCSHGSTQIKNGNELLANGRANRVKDALMVAGIDNEHIYDEGCWAAQPYDEVMPRRGVVLTLKKKIGSS